MKHDPLIGNAMAVRIRARQEPPVFIDDHPDPVGQAVHDVDSAVKRLMSLALSYENRKQMAADKDSIDGSILGLKIICSVLEKN